ncbi:MAG TPA: putative metalloprotease CJM1_0395 family protein [Candidatus Gastranaerophilaceae bacterium]|nr:putative metalloprotease CJM1_0395 family protein [Candidatus Gastranaerophilaceae bacterium]
MNGLSIVSGLAEYLAANEYIAGVPKIGEQGCCSGVSSIFGSNDDINDQALISDEATSLFEAEKTLQTSSGLTPEEQKEVERLKETDREVRAHEQAHIAASAGISTSSPHYTYVTGPDGQRYAVEGKVDVSFKESSDPQETIRRAQAMKSAATAPSDPSGQDFAVAAQAQQVIDKAEQELSQQNDKSSS